MILINKKTEDGYKKIFKISKKKKIDIRGNIHGTGCVFSSAITAYLSKGNDIEKSISLAEDFFNDKFQKFVDLPDMGKILDLTGPENMFQD